MSEIKQSVNYRTHLQLVNDLATFFRWLFIGNYLARLG